MESNQNERLKSMRVNGPNRCKLHKQWRRKMPKSVCVWGGRGGGTQTRDISTFGKEPI